MLAAGSTVVDVGANIGAFAIAAARRCHRDLRLICCEPVPALYRAVENLQKNRWLSGGARVVKNVALSTASDAGKSADFYYFRRFPRDSTMDISGKRRSSGLLRGARGAHRQVAGVPWAGAKLVERWHRQPPPGPVGGG